MGRYSISNQDKIAHGTDQPVRMQQEIGFTKIEKLFPHPELTGKAWKIYKILAQEFIARRILEDINDSLVAAYALELGTYYDQMEAIRLEGFIVKIHTKAGTVNSVNPRRKIASDCLEKATKLATQFGLTPASRAKIAAMLSGNEQKYDEFTEFE